MLNIIIGHRGTGKSHWLKRLKGFYRDNKIEGSFYDLDEEIEKEAGQSITELFRHGEAVFRRKEQQVFQKLIDSISKNKTCFLTVGAGFTFTKDPSWNVIYLSRHSDKNGRLFLDRPRLNSSQNPWEEYHSLYKKRQPFYLRQADEQLFRREHFTQLEDSDLLFLGLKQLSSNCFTFRLDPEDTPKDPGKLKIFLQKRLNWSLKFFELNDQTAEEGFIRKIRELVPENRILFSSQSSQSFLKLKNKKHWSWDLNLGEPPNEVTVLVLHQRRKKNLTALLKEFSSYKNYHLKLAVEILNLQELKIAYDWYCRSPKSRSFLPRSSDGRWQWFRQAFGPQMLLHFVKERSSDTEVLDQPFLSSALPYVQQPKALAGVLGDPILFSATPAEHDDFFNRERSVPVLPVPLKAEEMTQENLQIFSDLGFMFFAVTSPLKEEAFLSADICHKSTQQFKTANTLIFHKGAWQAFNTDWDGFQSLSRYSSRETVVWGGGGIRPVLKKLLPLARFYSARTASPLSVEQSTDKLAVQQNEKEFQPATLIWAVGRKRIQQGCLSPPKHWKPLKVIDINYTEDSPGREYALQIGADYKDGFEFFKAQAKKQREIFLHLKGGGKSQKRL